MTPADHDLVDLLMIAEGDWAGWRSYPGRGAFEELVGPHFVRHAPDGQVVFAFQAQAHHLSRAGIMHAGCLLAFADLCLFFFGRSVLTGARAATAGLSCQFIEPIGLGERVEGRGRIVRAGRSVVFIDGAASVDGAVRMTFSGMVKKVRRR